MISSSDLLAAARTIGGLLFVLAVAYLLARLARRTTGNSAGRSLRVIDRLALSREASLAVVQVGGRGLVLGITSHAVSVLGELDSATLEHPIRGNPPRGAGLRVPSPDQLLSAHADGVSVRRVADTPRGSAPMTHPSLSPALPNRRPPSGSVLSPATWTQAVEALRDRTTRRS